VCASITHRPDASGKSSRRWIGLWLTRVAPPATTATTGKWYYSRVLQKDQFVHGLGNKTHPILIRAMVILKLLGPTFHAREGDWRRRGQAARR